MWEGINTHVNTRNPIGTVSRLVLKRNDTKAAHTQYLIINNTLLICLKTEIVY